MSQSSQENEVSADAGPDVPAVLSPAAERALQEAAERRKLMAEASAERPVEVGGREGPDPARYGDWEKNGITSDF